MLQRLEGLCNYMFNWRLVIDLSGKKAPAWRRGMSKARASGTVYIKYTIRPPSFNQIIKEL
jgi:hypothetical protein